jgi:hypothetical protein
MVFSDSFLTDEDFSSMSDSEVTLEKEPPSDYDIMKQMGTNAALSGAVAFAAPALIRYGSRLMNSSNEAEDAALDSAALANLSNSASFSQGGNATGAFPGFGAMSGGAFQTGVS